MNWNSLLVILAILIIAALVCVFVWARVHNKYNKKYSIILDITSTTIFCLSVIPFYFTIAAYEYTLKEHDLRCVLTKTQKDVLYNCSLCDECFNRPMAIKTEYSPSDLDKKISYNCQLRKWFFQNEDSIRSCVMKGEGQITIVVPFSKKDDVYFDSLASYLQKSINEYNVSIDKVKKLIEKKKVWSLLEMSFPYIYIPLVIIALFVCILKWCLEWCDSCVFLTHRETPIIQRTSKKYNKWLWILVCFVGGVFPLAFYCWNFRNSTISSNPNDWSSFGSYIGGVYSVFVTLIAIYITRQLEKKDKYQNKKIGCAEDLYHQIVKVRNANYSSTTIQKYIKMVEDATIYLPDRIVERLKKLHDNFVVKSQNLSEENEMLKCLKDIYNE